MCAATEIPSLSGGSSRPGRRAIQPGPWGWLISLCMMVLLVGERRLRHHQPPLVEGLRAASLRRQLREAGP